MNKKEQRLENIKLSFGGLFFAANHLETLLDQYLGKYKLTLKQFFVSLILIQHSDSKPALSLGQVSERMGTSRQNVKQLLIKLENQGFCKIVQDQGDKRILRIKVTQKNKDFWESIDEKNIEILKKIFHKINDDTLNHLTRGLMILDKTISEMKPDQL